jgi:hypothetical protein
MARCRHACYLSNLLNHYRIYLPKRLTKLTKNMTKKQFDKLIEYIDAAIKGEISHDTSDGGLIESILKREKHDELEATLVTVWED